MKPKPANAPKPRQKKDYTRYFSDITKDVKKVTERWRSLNGIHNEIDAEQKPPWFDGSSDSHIPSNNLIGLSYSLLFLNSYETLGQALGRIDHNDVEMKLLRDIRNEIAHKRKRLDRADCRELRDAIEVILRRKGLLVAKPSTH